MPKRHLLGCGRRRVFDVDDPVRHEPEPLVIALDQGILHPHDDVVTGSPFKTVQNVKRFEDCFKLE